MTAPPIRVGIIGFGAIGQTHAAALGELAGVAVVAVARRGYDAALAARLPGVAWYHDYRELLARPDIDVVGICTPSGGHAEQALAALGAGKHVVVEKPLALSLADARQIVAEAGRRDLLLSVISQQRLEPPLRSLRDVLCRGDLGRPILGEALVRWQRDQAYYDSAPWRGTRAGDGGVLLNQAIHAIDLLCWLLGPVEAVTGHTATLVHRMEAEDTAVATLRFASGALGSVVATTAAPPGLPAELNIFGERGQVALHNATLARWAVPGVPPPPTPEGVGSGQADPRAIGTLGHRRQWADILAALREGRAPLVTGEEALRTLAVILAIEEASLTGHAVAPAT